MVFIVASFDCSVKCFGIFKLTVLDLWPAVLLFCITAPTSINLTSNCNRLFSAKAALYAGIQAPNGRKGNL